MHWAVEIESVGEATVNGRGMSGQVGSEMVSASVAELPLQFVVQQVRFPTGMNCQHWSTGQSVPTMLP